MVKITFSLGSKILSSMGVIVRSTLVCPAGMITVPLIGVKLVLVPVGV